MPRAGKSGEASPKARSRSPPTDRTEASAPAALLGGFTIEGLTVLQKVLGIAISRQAASVAIVDEDMGDEPDI